MGIEDVYAQQPVNPLDPMSLGVGPAPVMPQLPKPSLPAAQQPNQKALTLATIAAMITGGPAMTGLGHGLLAGQQHLDQQNQLRDRLNMQRYEQEQQNYDFQQRQYQSQLQARQKVLMDAVGAIRDGVAKNAFKNEDDYNRAVDQTAALLQNGYGMRVNGNFLRQAARYTAPNDSATIYAQLDKAFKNPLSGQQFAPEDRITYQSPTGPKTIALGDAVALSNYPVVTGPDGKFKKVGTKPMSPTEAAGIPGAFEAARTKYKTMGYTDDAAAEKARADVEKQQVEFERAKAAARQSVKPVKSVDPELNDIKKQTADINRQLAEQRLEAAKTKNAPPQESPYSIERTQRTLDSVNELLPQVSNWTVGAGRLLSGVPGTDARNFDAALNTLKSNIAFNELAEMRQASKTGGALGAVSDREGTLLESALGALDTGQSPRAFKGQLEKIKAILQRWKDAKTGGQGAAGAPVKSGPMLTYQDYLKSQGR